jgi:hypothetical protein
MVMTFRLLVISIAVIGGLIGIAFGIGVAYGKGDPQIIETGLTAQQIRSLLGVESAQASGATPGGGQGRGAVALGNNTIGQVTAVDGQTITVQTAQGSVKVTLGPSATVNTLSSGAPSSLQAGDTVIVSGTRGEDGGVQATSVSELPSELQALGSSGTAGGARPAPGGANTAP